MHRCYSHKAGHILPSDFRCVQSALSASLASSSGEASSLPCGSNKLIIGEQHLDAACLPDLRIGQQSDHCRQIESCPQNAGDSVTTTFVERQSNVYTVCSAAFIILRQRIINRTLTVLNAACHQASSA